MQKNFTLSVLNIIQPKLLTYQIVFWPARVSYAGL